MADFYNSLEDSHVEFIGNQHLFFVATAAESGRVNLSPKGMDSLRVLDQNTVLWLNLTGSGNETAAHLLDTNRMTLMFCSFDRQPLILRLYGQADTIHPRDEAWDRYCEHFPTYTGARQFFLMHVDMVQTSCGYAIPFYEHKGERHTLTKWADNKGTDGVQKHWSEKNQQSIDGAPTGILND